MKTRWNLVRIIRGDETREYQVLGWLISKPEVGKPIQYLTLDKKKCATQEVVQYVKINEANHPIYPNRIRFQTNKNEYVADDLTICNPHKFIGLVI